MAIKINSLELEHVKRIKAIKLEPSKNGLTIIGGRNEQGKSSVLDAIAWALGGNKFKPSRPQRDGSMTDPYLRVELSNGLIVERKGKNSSLTVTDPNGKKAGQALLDSFVEEFALNLAKFLHQSEAEKSKTLLQVIGLESQLTKLDETERKLYNKRHDIGVIESQKRKYAQELKDYDGVPDKLISASELIQQQQAILLKNAENQKHRENRTELDLYLRAKREEHKQMIEQIEALAIKHKELKAIIDETEASLKIAEKTVAELQDESTEEIEESLRTIEITNDKIKANLDKQKAIKEADRLKREYDELTEEITYTREQRLKLLDGANLPLKGLSIEDGRLTYNGQFWDGMSSSQRLKVATAISHAINPDCGFVLLDELEKFDVEMLEAFGEWLEDLGLQAIATRVSTGEECTLIIEDGYSVLEEKREKKWKAGEF